LSAAEGAACMSALLHCLCLLFLVGGNLFSATEGAACMLAFMHGCVSFFPGMCHTAYSYNTSYCILTRIYRIAK